MNPQQPHQPYPPQQGWQPPRQHNGASPYPSGGYALPAGRQYAPPQSPPTSKRRRIWPWVLLAIVLIPVLVVASCSALFVGGVSAVQGQRAGGTLPIGQTFTYGSGLAISVSQPEVYKTTAAYSSVGRSETAYQGSVTIINNTKNPEGTSLLTVNVTVNSVAAQAVYDDGLPPNQDLAPGQQARVPFVFKVNRGTKGPLQVSATPSLNEPVFFTGSLK